jgi:hypothetical protein
MRNLANSKGNLATSEKNLAINNKQKKLTYLLR